MSVYGTFSLVASLLFTKSLITRQVIRHFLVARRQRKMSGSSECHSEIQSSTYNSVI